MSIIHDLKEQMAAIQRKIESIQNQCSHPDECVVREGRSVTDEIGSTELDFINTYTCKLCEKVWSESRNDIRAKGREERRVK